MGSPISLGGSHNIVGSHNLVGSPLGSHNLVGSPTAHVTSPLQTIDHIRLNSWDSLENHADSLNFTLPECYRQSPYSSSSSSSSDVRSPFVEDSPAIVLFPSIDIGEPVKKVPSPKGSDPVNMTDQTVYVRRSRLDELEYIEANLKEIIALNLQKYIESEEFSEFSESVPPEESETSESNS